MRKLTVEIDTEQDPSFMSRAELEAKLDPSSLELMREQDARLELVKQKIIRSRKMYESASSGKLLRRQGEAKRVARVHSTFRCCVVCGLQIPTCLMVAHLDHTPGNNDPDNFAYLCQTHHWMYDAGLYPLEAIKLMRDHWQKTQGNRSHAARMKDAGPKAAATRKRRAAARKAVATRRERRAGVAETPHLSGSQSEKSMIVRRPPLNFDEMGVPEGSLLQSIDAKDATATVSGPRQVLFEGHEMSLTEATRRARGGRNFRAPCRHWKLNGKLLSDFYVERYGPKP